MYVSFVNCAKTYLEIRTRIFVVGKDVTITIFTRTSNGRI